MGARAAVFSRRGACAAGAGVLLVLALCLPYTAPFRAETGRYRFVNLVDSASSPLDVPFVCPAVNSAGTVAFLGHWKDHRDGVFAVGRLFRKLVTLADSKGEFNGFGNGVTINEAGLVCFTGHYPRNPAAVLTVGSRGGPLTLVAKTGELPNGFLMSQSCSINARGQVVFGDQKGRERCQILVGGSGGAPVVAVSDPEVGFSSIDVEGDLDDEGHVVFSAGLRTGGEILATVDRPGDAPTILVRSSAKSFDMMSWPVVNNRGDVLFHARSRRAPAGLYMIRRTGGTPVKFAECGPGKYKYFSHWSINDAGKVAFAAGVGDAHPGIYTGPDPVLDRVIVPGDALFGSTLDWPQTGRKSLNRQGEIAFGYILADERGGVALAVPVRWGAWGLQLLLACALLLGAFAAWPGFWKTTA